MKKEGMKKLLSDVNFVCFQEKVSSLFFWFALFCFVNFFAQSNGSNFGNLEIVKTIPGYTKISLTDLDSDGYKDILLYGSNKKYLIFHKNITDSVFAKPSKIYSKYPVDDIKLFTKIGKKNYFLLVSRNKRLLSFVTFSKKNKLQVLHRLKFNSYPSLIKIVDLNNNGKNEALLYGNNFDGLTIITAKGKKLKAVSLLKQIVIKDLDVIDFNQDNFKDIILIDMLKNSVKFYENYSQNKLNFNREIEFDKPLYKIENVNYNNDDFEDFMLQEKRNIEIFLGDSVYSFSKTKLLTCEITPDDFEFADINYDKTDEIILLDKKNECTIITSPQSSKEKYFLKALSDIDIIEDSVKTKIFELSKNGEIFILSNKNYKGKSFDFLMPGKSAITKFKTKANKLYLTVYDSLAKTISLKYLNSNGNFGEDEKIFLHNPITNFLYDKKKKIFAAYKKGERLLEIANGKKKGSMFIYSAKPLNKIKFDKRADIIALENEDGKFYYQKFIYKEKKYFDSEIKFIDTAVVAVKFGKGKNEIIYWKQEKEKLVLKKYPHKFVKNILSIENKDSNYSVAFLNGKSRNIFYTIVKNGKNVTLHSVRNKTVKQYKIENKDIFDNKFTGNNFRIMYDKKKKKTKLFYLNRKQNKLFEFTLSKKKKRFDKTKEIKAVNVNDFYVDIIFGKMYFVYSDSKNYSIAFRIIE